MKNVKREYLFSESDALTWLTEMPITDENFDPPPEVGTQTPIGFMHSAQHVVAFLRRCAEYEAMLYESDPQMEGVILSIKYEFDQQHPNFILLSFSYSPADSDGSVSSCLTCLKDGVGRYAVYGDQEYRSCLDRLRTDRGI